MDQGCKFSLGAVPPPIALNEMEPMAQWNQWPRNGLWSKNFTKTSKYVTLTTNTIFILPKTYLNYRWSHMTADPYRYGM